MPIESKTLKSSLGNNYEIVTGSSHSEIAPEVTEGATNASYTNFICEKPGSPGSAKCELATGMPIGSSVTINNSTELQKWIYRANNGMVFEISLNKKKYLVYDWLVYVKAQGPDIGLTTSLKLYFTDMTGDEYSLDIMSSKQKSHFLYFTSDNPNIKSIRWHDA